VSTIHSVFDRKNKTALIPYVTVGYPSIEATLNVVPLLAEKGCDIVELGIPFSDPIADGVTIQRAAFSALQNGVTPQLCLDVAEELRRKVHVPLLFMTYYNPVYGYGIERFCAACAGSGVDGLIIPDLPPEEGTELEIATGENDLDLVYLLTPTSTGERIKMVAGRSRGFIYLVSVTGVTGARDTLPVDLRPFVSRVREVARQPLCLGFGISTPEQAKMVAQVADGVIVGSKIIQLMENDSSLSSVGDFVASLRNAIDS
jgi:tryptophan synthase alpha chain